jgi:hypothetical protein
LQKFLIIFSIGKNVDPLYEDLGTLIIGNHSQRTPLKYQVSHIMKTEARNTTTTKPRPQEKQHWYFIADEWQSMTDI